MIIYFGFNTLYYHTRKEDRFVLVLVPTCIRMFRYGDMRIASRRIDV